MKNGYILENSTFAYPRGIGLWPSGVLLHFDVFLRFSKDLLLPISPALFKSRVQVWSDVGRYLYHCHPEQACRLVSDGSAFPADVQSNGRIWKLILTSDLSYLPAKPPTALSLSNYQGQRYIYRTKVRCPDIQRTNTICCFKKLDKRDRWAFVLSQTDAMENLNGTRTTN